MKNLPAAPKILQSLQWLLAKPETSLQQISALIQLEPDLSAQVVRVGPSMHFGQGVKVDNAFDAIQRVGLKGAEELVTLAVASQLVGRPLAAYGMGVQPLWNRAVACAFAAGNLAERCDDVAYNDTYTAGLMHGLGLLVIDLHVTAQKKPRIFASAGYPLDFAPDERGWLGFFMLKRALRCLSCGDFPRRSRRRCAISSNPRRRQHIARSA